MWSQKLYIFQNKITDFNHFMLSGSLTIVPIFVCSWRSDTTAFAFRWTLPLSSSSNFTVGATSFCRASEVIKKILKSEKSKSAESVGLTDTPFYYLSQADVINQIQCQK